jgi:hypothetical protein
MESELAGFGSHEGHFRGGGGGAFPVDGDPVRGEGFAASRRHVLHVLHSRGFALQYACDV